VGHVSDESLLLDDQLCFAIYAASRAVTATYRPLLEELGLTYPQYLVMLLLWDRGRCSVKEVGAALELDYGTVTPLLKRLAALGLVERHRRTDDERGVDVVLTAEGEALRSRAAAVPTQMGTAFGLSAAEREDLRKRLRTLTRSVHAFTAERVSPATG